VIRLAVAGAGAWGRNHIRALRGVRGARLTWVVEPDADRRAEAGQLAPRARHCADAEEALADPRLDALIIASPTPTHYPLARSALARGKHVLVEKPLAETSREGWDLVRRAEKAGRQLVVGHLLIYHPAVERLKTLVDRGRLGSIRYFHSRRTNLGRVRTDEGALWSLAPHDLSIMVYLLGRWPTAVAAQGATFVQPESEDLVFITLRFADGVMGHVHLSWLDALKVRRTCAVGTRCMAVFDDMDATSPLHLYEEAGAARGAAADVTGAGVARPQRVAAGQPLTREIQAFVRGIRTGEPSRTPGADGARVVRVLEAIQCSLADSGNPVTLRIR